MKFYKPETLREFFYRHGRSEEDYVLLIYGLIPCFVYLINLAFYFQVIYNYYKNRLYKEVKP